MVFCWRNHVHIQPWMISVYHEWHFHTKWDKLKENQADVFQFYPNAIRFDLFQFCPSMTLVGLSVFLLSCSTVLSCYFDISVNSMTNWPVLKLPKIGTSNFRSKCYTDINVLRIPSTSSTIIRCLFLDLSTSNFFLTNLNTFDWLNG